MTTEPYSLQHRQRQLRRARQRWHSERRQRADLLTRCEQLAQANAALGAEREATAAALWQLQNSPSWRTFQRLKSLVRRLLRPLLWCRAWLRQPQVVPIAVTPLQTESLVPASPNGPDFGGCPRVPSAEHFRVLFVVRAGHDDSASIRYRGHNIIEALRLRGVEADSIDDRELTQRLGEALTYDLLVLVRRQWGPEMQQLLEAAARARVPVVCDLDDLLFDDRSIPHVGFLRSCTPERAREWVRHWRELPARCPYFIGSTPHLQEQVAAMGKPSYLVPNGVNRTQLELSRLAWEKAQRERTGDVMRLGYFSGTPTHQSDFRLIAPTLVRLLEEHPTVRLIVTGAFDLTEFPELTPFGNRVESRPWVDWTMLPDEIARADVNLIPLEINYFTEGKSNLKYYEAALVKVPSVASPTQVFVQSIESGINGFLARTSDEWYAALQQLIVDPKLRRELGERAYRHALRTYVPEVIGPAALAAYRDILARHREQLGVAPEALTIVLLVRDLERAVRDRWPALTLVVELARLGVSVTLYLPPGSTFTAARADEFLAEHFVEPLFAIQAGGDIPCGAILLATDAHTATLAKRHENRARQVVYLVSEYEPLPNDVLGVPLIAFQPAVAESLWRHHQAKAEVVPQWCERHEATTSLVAEPKDLLVAATTDLPESLWHEALAALARLRQAHPDVRIALCGEAALRGSQATFWHHDFPWLDGPEFEALVAVRPVCVALFSRSEPQWLYDLQASGCPLAAVSADTNRQADCEPIKGKIRVPAEAEAIVTAIEALFREWHLTRSQGRRWLNASEAAALLLDLLPRLREEQPGKRIARSA